MSEILDNQEVTTEILNNIAIDLGATDFSAFDSTPFGVDRLNQITSELVTSGILLSGEKCAVTASESKVNIATGIIVFENGAKIRLTEPVSFDLIVNTYIYALNDTATNTAQILATEAEPVDGDFVMLAFIGEDGTVTDKRGFAMSKVLLPSGNSYLELSTGQLWCGADTEREYIINVGWNAWTYLHITNTAYGTQEAFVQDGDSACLRDSNDSRYDVYAKFEKYNNDLKITISSTLTNTINLSLIFM